MNEFSREEAEQILMRAARGDAGEVVSQDSLLHMAAEAGISEAAVRRATEEYAREREDQAIVAAFRARRKNKFFAELGSYASTCATCVAIWWFTGHHYFWPGWVVVGWGIGMVEQFTLAFMPRSRTYQRALEKYRAKQRAELQSGSTEFLDPSRNGREDRSDDGGVVLRVGIHHRDDR